MTDRRPVRIVTDSGADLPASVADALGITVVPLVVLLGQEAIEAHRLTPDAFWALVERSHAALGTSQPSPGVYYQVFNRLVQEGYDVVCITLTSRHSGTYSTACSAARPFGERVTVVDSHSLSVGMGYPAMEAASMALDGAPRDAIVARVASIRERSRVIIHLESMEQVRAGGRAALLVPLVDRLARVLSLKTALTIVDGELRLFGVARSTGKSLQRIAHEIASMGSLEHIGVMHVRAPELAQRLVTLMEPLVATARGQIVTGEAGPVLACHAGQGVVGVAAWSASPVS